MVLEFCLLLSNFNKNIHILKVYVLKTSNYKVQFLASEVDILELDKMIMFFSPFEMVFVYLNEC